MTLYDFKQWVHFEENISVIPNKNEEFGHMMELVYTSFETNF